MKQQRQEHHFRMQLKQQHNKQAHLSNVSASSIIPSALASTGVNNPCVG